jgi:hypothetical protein
MHAIEIEAKTAIREAATVCALAKTTVIVSSSRHLICAVPSLHSHVFVLILVPHRAVQSGSTVSSVHAIGVSFDVVDPPDAPVVVTDAVVEGFDDGDSDCVDAVFGVGVAAVVVAGEGAGVGCGVGAGVGHTPPGAVLTALVHEPPSWQLEPQKRQFGRLGCSATLTHCSQIANALHGALMFGVGAGVGSGVGAGDGAGVGNGLGAGVCTGVGGTGVGGAGV